jgi:hypothetical protein
VLEHVYDIPAFFAAARSVLAPGGYLYLETPDATRYGDYLYAPFQEFNTEHINHFSKCALENAARRFGFKPVLVEQKLIQTAADTLYPAVFGIFRDQGEIAEQRAVVRDRELPSAIDSYIQHSAEQMEQINQHLAKHLTNTSEVILWGAGQLAMKLLALPCFAQLTIRALVDNNPILKDKAFAGTPVVGPQHIASTAEPIIITTLLHDDEIRAQIRQLGLSNPVISLRNSNSKTRLQIRSQVTSEAAWR